MERSLAAPTTEELLAMLDALEPISRRAAGGDDRRMRMPAGDSLDASALVDLLLGTERADWVESWFPRSVPQFAAPDLIGYELMTALRRNVAAGTCRPGRR